MRKFNFSNRIIPIWNSLPDHVVASLTINTFKARLDNSTQREFTDAGETPHCPHLFIKIKYKTIRHILLVLIYVYLQFWLGRL